jgi:hypothetical protein
MVVDVVFMRHNKAVKSGRKTGKIYSIQTFIWMLVICLFLFVCWRAKVHFVGLYLVVVLLGPIVLAFYLGYRNMDIYLGYSQGRQVNKWRYLAWCMIFWTIGLGVLFIPGNSLSDNPTPEDPNSPEAQAEKQRDEFEAEQNWTKDGKPPGGPQQYLP